MATMREYYITGDDGTYEINHANDRVAQTFHDGVASYIIGSVKFKLYRVLLPGNITVTLRTTDGANKPTTTVLSTGTTDGDTLTVDTAGEWREITFAVPYTLTDNVLYALVISVPGATATKKIFVRQDVTTSLFTDGEKWYSGDAETSWDYRQGGTDDDCMFKTYGSGVLASGAPVDKTYSRQLVAIGDNEVWYESAANTMSKLTTDVAGDINTAEPLTIVEAFQKVFVANRTNLKIVDFANTKLTVAALTTVPTRGDVLTQVTSGAKMIVDFVNGAKTEIYGYTTGGTFDTASTVDSDPARTPSAVDEASTTPHWYDWSEYGVTVVASTNMPSSAYLVALYRGRVVLAGNKNEPHMWWMSKVADPFNYAYSSTVVTSAVAGNNTKAGKIGDIIRTMISFGDDFLVFGCANSVHVLDGDPLADGSIDKLSDDTGIFSWTSWCKDDADNLYFYGNHGIYMMAGGRGKPTNISKSALPNLALDWAVDPSLHRVVLAYDAVNRGVVIVRTTLANGVCSGYFYSLDTAGFYPISFANTADGIFCSFDYNADDPTYRKLLFGCTDGYIRKLLGTNKNDDYGDASSTEPISSYFGIVDRLSEDSDKEGKLTSLTVEMSGGRVTTKLTHAALAVAHAKGDTLTQATTAATVVVAYTNAAKTQTFGHTGTGTFNTTNAVTGDGSGTGFTPTAVGTGSFTDTDGCSYEYHKGDDAESCLERVKDGAAPFTSGTLTGPGRKNRIRKKMRGAWAALKFYNSTASETFGINNVYGDIKPTGKKK